MTLKRSGTYWKPGRANFDEVEMLGRSPTRRQRMNAMVTGRVDAIDRVDIKSLALFQRNKEIIIDEVTGTQH